MTIVREKHKIHNNVFDDFTNKVLFKLASQGFFDTLTNQIGIGKEANVFLAKKQDGSQVIVKIYRLENCNFNKMYEYIKGDPRYADLKGRRRELIFSWVSREFKNLHKAREVGVSVPTPHTCMQNVLVMEAILQDGEPAHQLKSTAVENPQKFVKEVLASMQKLYQDANIVHADLSPFNILVQHQKPVLIDMSQSTDIKDSMALTFLKRDVHNLCLYAKRNGMMLDEEEIVKKIMVKA